MSWASEAVIEGSRPRRSQIRKGRRNLTVADRQVGSVDGKSAKAAGRLAAVMMNEAGVVGGRKRKEAQQQRGERRTGTSSTSWEQRQCKCNESRKNGLLIQRQRGMTRSMRQWAARLDEEAKQLHRERMKRGRVSRGEREMRYCRW